MKVVVAAFNQEKALVWAFSVIVKSSVNSNVGNVSATQVAAAVRAAAAAGHQAAVARLLEAAPRLLVTALVSPGPTRCLRWGTLQNSAVLHSLEPSKLWLDWKVLSSGTFNHFGLSHRTLVQSQSSRAGRCFDTGRQGHRSRPAQNDGTKGLLCS